MIKFSLYIIFGGLLLFVFIGQVEAATVEFTADTEVGFTDVPATVYINSGSECDSFIVSTSTLNADIPAGSTFTLETGTYTVLALTPTGGTTTLAFDTTYFGSGYVSQWTASSSVSTTTTSFTVGVSEAGSNYVLRVGGSFVSNYVSNSNSLVTFNYVGGYSNRTFTVTRDSPVLAGTPWYRLPDVGAPEISQIEVITKGNQATISWKTNENSVSWIVYGITTDYGLEKKTDDFTLSHSLTLTDLSPETIYHYYIKSEDKLGNIGHSEDRTFTTLSSELESELEEVLVSKPISEMTIEELESEVNRITALIANLQAQLTVFIKDSVYEGIPAGFIFEKSLKYGNKSDDIKYLQIILKKEIGEPTYPGYVPASGWFGPVTKSSVIAFQEKYASDILDPWEITEGTGFIGKTTRAKLNEFLSNK